MSQWQIKNSNWKAQFLEKKAGFDQNKDGHRKLKTLDMKMHETGEIEYFWWGRQSTEYLLTETITIPIVTFHIQEWSVKVEKAWLAKKKDF